MISSCRCADWLSPFVEGVAGYVETKRQARCRRQGESTWKAGKRSETYPRRSNDRFGFNFIKAVFYPRRLECLFGHIRPFASSHSPHVLLSEAKNAPQQADNYASKIHPNPTVDKIKTASYMCISAPLPVCLGVFPCFLFEGATAERTVRGKQPHHKTTANGSGKLATPFCICAQMPQKIYKMYGFMARILIIIGNFACVK